MRRFAGVMLYAAVLGAAFYRLIDQDKRLVAPSNLLLAGLLLVGFCFGGFNLIWNPGQARFHWMLGRAVCQLTGILFSMLGVGSVTLIVLGICSSLGWAHWPDRFPKCNLLSYLILIYLTFNFAGLGWIVFSLGPEWLNRRTHRYRNRS